MSYGEIFLWEALGTGLLTLLGCGVVANVTLRRTLGNAGGPLMVNFGWGFAVFTGASVAAPTEAHINPAVTIGMAVNGQTQWSDVPAYMSAQVVGAFVGGVLCWAAYKLQFDTHDDPANTRGIFCTGPTVRHGAWNTVTEVIGTFVLMLWIIQSPQASVGDTPGIPDFGNAALGYAGGGVRRVDHRQLAGRAHGLRHQPGSRPRSAHRVRRPADPREGTRRVELLVGSDRGPAAGRSARGSALPRPARHRVAGPGWITTSLYTGR